MRILILGAGSAGQMLAARLCGDQHDVLVIDRKQSALDQIDAQLDALTFLGDATDPHVLEEAGLRRCDMVVAVTEQESVNILACALAHIAGVPRKIARISNSAYMKPDSPFNLSHLGIDLVVNQQMECAQDLYNILRIPGAHEVVELLGGRVLCVGFQLPTFTPLIMGPLKDYPDPALLATIRFVAYTSAGKLGIPHGETQFTIGDIVYLVGEPDKIQHFLKTALPSETSYTRVVIAGGGELGLQLATRLFGGDLDITLVEENTARAEVCSDLLPHALVMNGSSLNNELMMELGINDHTAFVAVTGDDENNIMSCLVAEKMGAHFTVARVDNRNYRPIIDSLALVDRVVSPQSSLINAIYHFVRGANVKGDRLLQKIPGEVVEFHVGAGHPWAGKDVIDIPIPRGCIISTVLRGEELLIATGKTRMTVGDRVLVYGLPKSIKKLDSLLG